MMAMMKENMIPKQAVVIFCGHTHATPVAMFLD